MRSSWGVVKTPSKIGEEGEGRKHAIQLLPCIKVFQIQNRDSDVREKGVR